MQETGDDKAAQNGSAFETDYTSPDIIEYRFHGFRLDVTTHSLYDPDGELRNLSMRALDTLKLLIEHRGQALAKNTLLETVWPDTFVQENNLNQVISSIRKALGDSKNSSQFIKTLIGKGYCFVADLEEIRAHKTTPATTVPVSDALQHVPPLPAHFVTETAARRRPGSATVYGAVLMLAMLGILGLGYRLKKADVDPATATAQTSENNIVNALTGGEINGIMRGSIAVLPFTNLSGDGSRAQQTFAMGLHDELINQLSQMRSLKIVSRNSVITPALQGLSLQELGAKLHVGSVITGSIMFIEDQARIKLQMLNPANGVITWAYDYDIDTGSLKDMIEANRAMAAEVAHALESDVSMVTYPEILSSPTSSFEAYRYNMAARHAYNNQNFRKTLSLSKRALALDPNYQGALYHFARSHFYLASSPLDGMTTEDHMKRSLESAERLIALAPDKYEGYVLKASVLGALKDWEGVMAEVAHLKAMNAPLWELQPLAPVLMSLGYYQLSINILQANIQVEPLNGFGRGFLMAAYEAVGSSMQARMEYDIGEELTPQWWGDVVNFFIALGRGEQFSDFDALQGTSDEVKEMLQDIYTGDRARTLSKLNAAMYGQVSSTSRYVHYAAIAALLDEHGLAVDFLKRSVRDMPIHLHWIWQPVFRETWNHPQFVTLLEDTDVLNYWQQHGLPSICDTRHEEYFICHR
jgi:DNA-binding winged helix-turn-helix (wHTH) protein/TolB-like protein